MSYGLQIYNEDGRTQINSEEVAPNTYITGKTASAYSAMGYPPSGFTQGDLILARIANTPVTRGTGVNAYVPMARGRDVSNGLKSFHGSKAIQDAGFTYEFANTAGINTALLKTQSGNIAGPSSGEFGLDVYKADGTTILFSATRSTSVKVLAQGTLNQNETFTYECPAGLTFSKIYVVMNSTYSIVYPANFVFPSWSIQLIYKFYPNSSPQKIQAVNSVTSDGQPVPGSGTQFSYVIVYDPN